MKYKNNDLYEGNWEYGIKKGKGKYIFENGSQYEGEWD